MGIRIKISGHGYNLIIQFARLLLHHSYGNAYVSILLFNMYSANLTYWRKVNGKKTWL